MAAKNSDNLNEQAQETADKIIANAEAKAQELLAGAEAKIKQMFEQAQQPAVQNITIEQPKEVKASLPDYIKKMQDDMTSNINVQLFEDGDKYIGDVFASVNGKYRYQIQRGENVSIPHFIQDVLEQSQVQDTKTVKLMKKKEEEMKQADRNVGYTVS